jgi:hypothetical protein
MLISEGLVPSAVALIGVCGALPVSSLASAVSPKSEEMLIRDVKISNSYVTFEISFTINDNNTT